MLQPARAAQGAHHVSLLREADCTLWGFLQTHKTAMVGNVLTPGGLLLRLTEFILPPPHPSVKESDPRRADSYDQIVKVAASSLVFWVSFWIGLTDRWYFGKPGPNKDAKYSVPRCQ